MNFPQSNLDLSRGFLVATFLITSSPLVCLNMIMDNEKIRWYTHHHGVPDFRDGCKTFRDHPENSADRSYHELAIGNVDDRPLVEPCSLNETYPMTDPCMVYIC